MTIGVELFKHIYYLRVLRKTKVYDKTYINDAFSVLFFK